MFKNFGLPAIVSISNTEVTASVPDIGVYASPVTTQRVRLLNSRLELAGRQTGRSWLPKWSGDERRTSAMSCERSVALYLGCSTTRLTVTCPLSLGREPWNPTPSLTSSMSTDE